MTRALLRWRPRLVAVAAVLMGAAFAFSAVAAGTTTPALGWKHAFPNGVGFGQVRPPRVFLGGDPTGNVTGLRWHDWGRATTIAHGTGWCARTSVADGYHCTVSLHASDLGTCHRRRAYRTLTFYFKPAPHKRWMFGSKWNACPA